MNHTYSKSSGLHDVPKLKIFQLRFQQNFWKATFFVMGTKLD